MKFTVTVEPSGQSFTVEDSEAVLAAGIRQGIGLSYGCRNGICGSCKVSLISGDITYPEGPPETLSDEDKEAKANIGVLCQAHARSDLIIETQLVGLGKDVVVKKLPCRIQRKELLSHDVIGLWLKLPVTERLQFLAGQYIDILINDGRHRSFSIANAPHDDEYIELHIRRIEGGDFTRIVFEELKEKSMLRIEGPHGSFFLREESTNPMIFMAGGTGFAPIKGIIEHAIEENITRPIQLYWGVQAKRDFYMLELAQGWANQCENISFTPVLSNSDPLDHWQGRQGWVHDIIVEDYSDLGEYDIYASGPPAMVDAGKSAFAKAGLKLSQYYSDAFDFQDHITDLDT
jgi:CDP-4-dehydro-6-deoxyglucose reductase